MFQISLLTVLLVVAARADVDINLLQEENRLLAGSDNVQEKAIQYKSAGKRLPSVQSFLLRDSLQEPEH